MVLLGPGVNKDVVQVDEDMFVEHVTEHVIDEGLEDGRGISEAKGHDKVFVMPGGHVEGRLPLVPLSDADQVVGVAEV